MIQLFGNAINTCTYKAVGKLVPMRKKEVQMRSSQSASGVPSVLLFSLVLRVYTRWHARKAEQVQKLGAVHAEFLGTSHALGLRFGVSYLICNCLLFLSPPG